MSVIALHRVALLDQVPADHLLIHEIYASIQGESTYAGLPCTFVRLAVCNLRCSYCDTPHAFNRGDVMPLATVLSAVERLGVPLVEVTGGEPLLQSPVHPLMTALCDRGFQVLLETSGERPIDAVDPRVRIIMDIKCPTSGEAAGNRWANLGVLKPGDEVKFVIGSRDDFDWSLPTIRDHRLHERGPVLMSPVFGAVAPADLAAWVLASKLPIRMQVQMHKVIWEPERRGV